MDSPFDRALSMAQSSQMYRVPLFPWEAGLMQPVFCRVPIVQGPSTVVPPVPEPDPFSVKDTAYVSPVFQAPLA